MGKTSPTTLKYFQKFGWLVLRPILKFFIRYRYSADCDIKDLTSPFIIVSNHISYLDPPIIGTVMPFNCPVYPAYFITKDKLMTVPLLGSFLKYLGAFRACRGEGLEKSLEEPKKILSSGCSLVFFPQGSRKQDFMLEHGKPGAASLALQTGTPILPAAICGLVPFSWKNFFWRRYRVRVRIGRPFSLKEKLAQHYISDENLEVATQIVMREIQKLME